MTFKSDFGKSFELVYLLFYCLEAKFAEITFKGKSRTLKLYFDVLTILNIVTLP